MFGDWGALGNVVNGVGLHFRFGVGVGGWPWVYFSFVSFDSTTRQPLSGMKNSNECFVISRGVAASVPATLHGYAVLLFSPAYVFPACSGGICM